MTAPIGIDFGSVMARAAFWNTKNQPETFQQKSPDVKRKWMDPDLSGTVREETASLMKEIKGNAEQTLKSELRKAAFSVPVLWNSSLRKKFQQTVEPAGFHSLGMIPETGAALLAYGHFKKKTGLAGVYSFGGGFFEFGVAEIQPGKINLLAADGLMLGGKDFDKRIAQGLMKEAGGSWSQVFQNDMNFQGQILEESEKARCALSHRGSYDLRLEHASQSGLWSHALSRFEILKWVRDLIEKSIAVCEQVMKKAGILPQDLGDVFLAGGLTRTPFIQETVESFFRKKPLMEINPDLAVVLGTLVYAGIQDGSIKDCQWTAADLAHER